MKKIITIAMAALAISAVACKKDNTNNVGDENNGKTEITVAKDALVAYFPMEDESEKVGGLTVDQKGTTSAANFVAGRNGKCFQGGENQYLLYNLPEKSAILDAKGVTLSFWLNQPVIPQSQAPTPMYFQLCSTDHFWGNLSVTCDRTNPENGEDGFLKLKPVFRGVDGKQIWKGWNADYADSYTAARWIHVIYTYDNVSSEFHAYVNGIDITPENQVACIFDENPSGDLHFENTEKVIIGGWYGKILGENQDEWMGWMENVKIDEIRLYNRALTAEESSSLYDAEIANID